MRKKTKGTESGGKHSEKRTEHEDLAEVRVTEK